jgi:protein TonB
MASRPLYLLSIAAHAILGVSLAAIRPAPSHETVAISFIETRKAKPIAPVELPRAPEPPPAVAAPVHAVQRTAAPQTPSSRAPAQAPAGAGLDALPDFGISLGGGAGLAIPAPGPAATAAAEHVERALARPVAPKHDDCTEPPIKPKPLSRPTPAYTAQARAAGVAGKVRVEIIVDEQGHVTSARLVERLGHGLDEAALASARAMTFEPGTRCGKPSATTFKIGFTFSPSSS